jgi:hypothetical protein
MALGILAVNEHRTLASVVKDALDRYLAQRRVRGEPPDGRGTDFWIHVIFAFIIVAICLYFFLG